MVYVVNDELYHHGIKGQKWGVRRWQNADGTFNEAGKKRYFGDGGSAGGTARRALAKVYDINAKFYSKNGRNKTLASMNAAARDEMLKKADEADKAKAEKKAASEKEKADKAEAKAAKEKARTDKIDADIKKAGSAEEMERALKQKVKEDIRSSQGKLSRLVNDISGYNNALAKQVVNDVAQNKKLSDIKNQRSKMTNGQKFVDALSGASSLNASSNYKSKGYKDLAKEYEQYKASGGIKKSKNNYAHAQKVASREAAARRATQEREREQQYKREQEKRNEEMARTARNMDYLTRSYQNAIDYGNRYR